VASLNREVSGNGSAGGGGGWGQWAGTSASSASSSHSLTSVGSSSSTCDSAAAAAIHPIGAGDAVAAGTLAAWKCLLDGNFGQQHGHYHGKEDSASATATTAAQPCCCLPPVVQAALEGNQSPFTRAMLAAFSFGLACGTAKCLHEEMAMLQLSDVLDFYNRQGRPVFVSSHVMPM